MIELKYEKKTTTKRKEESIGEKEEGNETKKKKREFSKFTAICLIIIIIIFFFKYFLPKWKNKKKSLFSLVRRLVCCRFFPLSLEWLSFCFVVVVLLMFAWNGMEKKEFSKNDDNYNKSLFRDNYDDFFVSKSSISIYLCL